MDAHKRAVKALNTAGYFFKRTGANHDIQFNAENRRIIPLKRHDFDETDLRYIEKEIKQGRQK